MRYRVELIRTEVGYSVGCPDLPGLLVAGRDGRRGAGEH